jgi:hypothetical protein
VAAIRAWQAETAGRPAPAVDPAALQQVIYEAFVTIDGDSRVDRLCEDGLDLARTCGLTVEDARGELLPDVLDAIIRIITQAIWFGLTTGYLMMAGSYHTPYRLLPGYSGAGTLL